MTPSQAVLAWLADNWPYLLAPAWLVVGLAVAAWHLEQPGILSTEAEKAAMTREERENYSFGVLVLTVICTLLWPVVPLYWTLHSAFPAKGDT